MYLGSRRALLGQKPSLVGACRVVAALDFRRGRLWSGSKGLLSVAQTITTTRPDTGISTAPRRNGMVAPFGAGVARVTDDGLFAHGTRQNSVKRNLDMTDTSVWSTSSMTPVNNGPWPFTTGTALRMAVLPAGTSSWTVPADWDSTANTVRCLAAAGDSTAGVAGATRVTGATGGSGGYAETSNIVLTPGATITGIAVPAHGSGGACTFPDDGGTVRVKANSGTSASGATAGTGGSNTGAVGTLRRAGANGTAGSSGATNRGGPGGPGAPGPDGAVGSASGGNTNGGGGGSGPNGTGSGNTTATSTDGGRGGDNSLGTGHGVGGNATTAATNGTAGGAGAGGKSGVGIHGSNGSNQIFSVTDSLTGDVLTYEGAGGGGGGGGLGGDGGDGGLGAAAGAGGATDTLSGAPGVSGDGVIVITWGGAASSRLVASADNAWVKQTVATSTMATRAISALIYQEPGTTLVGQVLLTQDDFVTTTDVSGDAIPGQFVDVVGPVQTANTDRVIGVKLTSAADSGKICCILMQLESGDTASNKIPTQASAATRNEDIYVLNNANFPAFLNDNVHTAFVVCKPTALPEPAPEDRTGWNVLSISSAFTTQFVGTGYINGDDTLVIATATSGTVAVGGRIKIGTGVVSFTDIAENLTGSGGVGTYRVTVDGVSGVAQTTAGAPTPVAIEIRNKDLVQYLLNAAPKPLEEYQLRIGLTVRDETQDETTAWDPQKEFAPHNRKHALGWTINAAKRYGITFLNGDYDESDQGAGHFTFVPDVSAFSTVVFGTVGPDGVGASVEGPIELVYIVQGEISASMGARLTDHLRRAAA